LLDKSAISDAVNPTSRDEAVIVTEDAALADLLSGVYLQIEPVKNRLRSE
jgi:hypothetical protein